MRHASRSLVAQVTAVYSRRRSEETTLYAAVRNNLATLYGAVEEAHLPSRYASLIVTKTHGERREQRATPSVT
jgi:hypothetical protein